jgi:hypothetical protein
LLRRLPAVLRVRLTTEERTLLGALLGGCHLKVHRTVDGTKTYRLHGLQPADEPGQAAACGQELPAARVEFLEHGGYLQSNMKFPAATLLLTERGRRAALGAATAARTSAPGTADTVLNPVGPHRY